MCKDGLDSIKKKVVQKNIQPSTALVYVRGSCLPPEEGIRNCVYGETSKFKFSGARFPHSLTKSNIIVCDFCRSLTELSGLSIQP